MPWCRSIRVSSVAARRYALTKAQRDALLLLPDTVEAFVRHYSLFAEDIEIISGYRTPESRLRVAPDSRRAGPVNPASSQHTSRGRMSDIEIPKMMQAPASGRL